MKTVPPLTKKQADALHIEFLCGKKHWSQKIIHALKIVKRFYPEIQETDLQWYLEEYVPSEIKRHKKLFMQKSASGELNNNYTPTDVSNSISNQRFNTPKKLVIGVKYHLSWAYKGAVFVLKRIEGEYCYLDNPKNPRVNLLKAKISELRSIKKTK